MKAGLDRCDRDACKACHQLKSRVPASDQHAPPGASSQNNNFYRYPACMSVAATSHAKLLKLLLHTSEGRASAVNPLVSFAQRPSPPRAHFPTLLRHRSHIPKNLDMATNEQSAAWPIADTALATEILDLTQQVCSSFRQCWLISANIVQGQPLPPAQEGRQRGHQDPQPWYRRAHHPRR